MESLIKFNFRHELAIAQTFEEIKYLDNKAAAIAEFARKENLSIDQQNEIGIYRVEIASKKGEWLDENFPHGGDRVSESSKLDQDELDKMPITFDESAKARTISHEPEFVVKAFEEIKEKKEIITPNKVATAIKKYKREERDKNLETPKLPEGQFNIIYADPPWKYEHSRTKSRDIENQYPTMGLEEIKLIKIPTADNCVLFLWATAPKLEEALSVLNSWGFTYRTCAIWDKEIIGMGYWFRGQHEVLLVGVKGEFKPPDQERRVSSVYKKRRSKHSSKPSYYYDLIEKCYPDGKYLELFSRKKHNDKWAVYGNEV